MINKILCILLLLLFIILLIKLYEKINIYKINNSNRTLKLYDTMPNNNSNNLLYPYNHLNRLDILLILS